jgi:hypothetical protein
MDAAAAMRKTIISLQNMIWMMVIPSEQLYWCRKIVTTDTFGNFRRAVRLRAARLV